MPDVRTAGASAARPRRQNGASNVSTTSPPSTSRGSARDPRETSQATTLLRRQFSGIDFALVSIYPLTLLLGIGFRLGHPSSYFAHATNLLNLVFVKNGWAWTTIAFLWHATRLRPALRRGAALRWVAATVAWILVTQWAFGPALTDRTMTLTGGVCELAADAAGGATDAEFAGSKTQAAAILTNAACKKLHGKFRGGHDLSGHVFLLTHASLFLIYEVLLPVFVTGSDSRTTAPTRAAGAVVVGWWWMLLMTAAYFHTPKEKFTGLVTGLVSWLCVYKIAPALPVVADVVGRPAV